MTNDKKPDPPGRTLDTNDNDNDNDDNNNTNNNVGLSNSDSNSGISFSSNSASNGNNNNDNNNDNNNNNNNNAPLQKFSPVRGHMDDAGNFEFANDTHNANTPIAIASLVSTIDDNDLGVEINLSRSNSKDSKNSHGSKGSHNDLITTRSHTRNLPVPSKSDDDDYIEEMEEGKAMLPRNHNHTKKGISSDTITTSTTTPAILYSDPMNNSTAPLTTYHHNHHHNHNNHRGTINLNDRDLAYNLDQYNQNVEMSPALRRRLRDFTFAQRKRRERYGEQNPWGIIGLYDHLTGIRTDVEWAEDAAWRRENDQPYLSWQDFEDAKDTGFNQPFFTYFTMLVCTVCLVVSIGLNGWTVQPMTENPMIGPSAAVLLQMGAKDTSLIVYDNEWYRLLTSMFLHAGIIHFVINMLALWFIGYAVEQSHGFFAAAILFILPAIGGTLLSAIFLPEYISVGASGGIFGLIGACIADIIINWGLLFSKHVNDNNIGQRFRHIKVLIWLVLDIILNIVIGLTPFVDNFTHMGGMVFGFCCGLSTMERLSKAFFGVKTKFLARFQTFLVRFFGIIFTCLCILGAFIFLVSLNDGKIIKCRGCRYISCVPFPFWETENKWWYCDDCNKPVVRAQLYQDTQSFYYTHMDLTCPDNSTITNITLTEKINDQQHYQNNLGNYCREECDVLFSN